MKTTIDMPDHVWTAFKELALMRKARGTEGASLRAVMNQAMESFVKQAKVEIEKLKRGGPS